MADTAGFAAGASSADDLGTALTEACNAALSGLGSGTSADLALLFVWGYGMPADNAVELLAPRLPAGCHLLGCQGSGIVGADGRGGTLLDAYYADIPPAPQQGVSLLLGCLPGRLVAPFTTLSQAAGPGARHRAGSTISAADADADRESLLRWLQLPAGSEPLTILLFAQETVGVCLPHAHGMLARLQRAFPDAVITGALTLDEESIYCLPGCQPGSSGKQGAKRADKGRTANICGLTICRAAAPAPAAAEGAAADGGGLAGAAQLVAAAMSVKGCQGEVPVFYDVRVTRQITTTRNTMHPQLGDIPVLAVDSCAADPAVLRANFRVDHDPSQLAPTDSVLIQLLMEVEGSGELAFWCADASDAGNFESNAAAGRRIVLADMALKRDSQGLFYIVGTVHPLEQATFDAMVEESLHARGKTLCAQFLRLRGAGEGHDILESQVPLLLARQPAASARQGALPAAAAASQAPCPTALVLFREKERKQALFVETEIAKVHSLAPQVPLVGVCCSGGVLGPNLLNNWCSVRSVQDGAPGPAGGRAAGTADETSSGHGSAADEDVQLRLFGVDRSDLLGWNLTLLMLAG